MERGRPQLGTLGSGNHFLEIEIVTDIYDEKTAAAFGLVKDQVTVFLHSGSRGLGYQVCDDYLARMVKQIHQLDFSLPDRQLACAYIASPAGRDYLSAMACAANYAWANRQLLTHWSRETFRKILHKSPQQLGMRLLYDVCHTTRQDRKISDRRDHGRALRSSQRCHPFPSGGPPSRAETLCRRRPACPHPRRYGHGILHPRGNGRGLYGDLRKCLPRRRPYHEPDPGREASRGRTIVREMADQGVLVMASGKGTLQEEIPEAYKRVDDVVEVVHLAGLAGRWRG